MGTRSKREVNTFDPFDNGLIVCNLVPRAFPFSHDNNSSIVSNLVPRAFLFELDRAAIFACFVLLLRHVAANMCKEIFKYFLSLYTDFPE